MAAFDTAATQPGHLDRQSWLTLGDGEIEEEKKKPRRSSWNSWSSVQSMVFKTWRAVFFPARPQLASQLAGFSLWAKNYIC